MTSLQSLEHHEHAEHIMHSHGHGDGHGHDAPAEHASSAQWTALMVAFLAAGLAIAEQGARHAEIKVQQDAISAADAWDQYQGKSTRSTVAKDMAAVVAVIDVGTDPARVAKRDALVAQLKADQETYDHDPKDGRDAITRRAHGFEELRNEALEQTHAYHNGSASYELGIVLATASAITKSRLLFWIAAGLGVAGIVLTALGYWAPEYGAL